MSPESQCPYSLGVQVFPLNLIKPNDVSLRSVNRKSERFLQIVDSIAEKGFIGAISGRPSQEIVDGVPTGNWFVEVIDGLHRYTAACELGLTEINIDIQDLDDSATYEYQLMANLINEPTKPAESAKHLRRLMDMNPEITVAGLAKKLAFSPATISQRLSLNSITNENVRSLIDSGKIKLANAYSLAKLPESEVQDWVESAMLEQHEEFGPKIIKRLKDIKDANQQGKDAPATVWTPTAHLRKLNEIKEELANGKAARAFSVGELTASEAFTVALNWVLHLDKISVDAAREKEETRKKQQEEAKQKREAEKNKSKARSSVRKLREAQLEADISAAMLESGSGMTNEKAAQMRDDLKRELDAEETAASGQVQEVVEATV